jgi:hypothetical protein
MSTKVNGLMTKPKEKVSISIKMVLHIPVNGSMTNNMAMEYKNGLMVPNMKDISTKD